eukprot:CAMPEP_0205931636 /NCGR_PEP_ID=MMETSP1325-20131115/27751_1 /ASSEMBLY_ACC=CAM_ASM_000708 /TAXON_ID=236786 /ORGANISM="Florenciella sp., Strain RCC1007" /LENGTH=57 /DNA_ID=CAMNT_0053301233 /DNA_START=75 /DNA_END=245 /DNA_ORIENTATION=-
MDFVGCHRHHRQGLCNAPSNDLSRFVDLVNAAKRLKGGDNVDVEAAAEDNGDQDDGG